MKVSTKLSLSFGLILVAAAIIAVISMVHIKNLSTEIDNLANDKLPRIMWGNHIIIQVNLIAQAMRDSLLTRDKETIRQKIEQIHKSRKNILEDLSKLEKITLIANDKAMLKKVIDARAKYVSTQEQFIQLITEGRQVEATEYLLTKSRPLQDDYLKSIYDLAEYQNKLMIDVSNQTAHTANSANFIIIGLCLIALTLGIIVVYLMKALQNTIAGLSLAREQADAANRAKSSFLANMSHEIRTPMNSVLGMAQIALRRTTDTKQIHYLRTILTSGDHLLSLINNILDFSRIEAGKMAISDVNFNFNQVIEILSSMILPLAKAKGLALIFEIDPNIPPGLQGDPMRLAQILINYAGNAVKFSEHGQVVIRARVVEESEQYCVLHCEVQDSGIGIAPDDHEKLFQSFEQLDASTTRKFGGSGLGLAISKNLAHLMGGEVGVTSQPGQGCTFWFTARIGKGEPVPVSRPFNAAPFLAGLPVLNDADILLVEDNVFNQEVVKDCLEQSGANILIANNGQEALDMLKKHTVDLVLMDVQMPIMNGIEATRHIRANPALEGLPIIAMTASARSEDLHDCLSSGMDDFIDKPVKLEKLYATLVKWLQTRPDRLEAVLAEAPPGSSQAAIDLNILANMLGNDPVLIQKYATRFLQTTADSISEMEVALARGNMKELAALGHRTKSSARMVGALEFADLCQILEEVKQGDGHLQATSGQAAKLISLLKMALTQVKTEVEKL